MLQFFVRIEKKEIEIWDHVCELIFLYFPFPFSVVQRPIIFFSANPGLNFNPGLSFFCSKAFCPTIYSILFRVSSHQILDKKSSAKFSFFSFHIWNQISLYPWVTGPCGFRPFDFHSILKIENQNFAIVIFNVWSSKSEIKNLQSQFSIFVAKGKIEHHTSIFWKSKTKNWKWPVSGFNFLFSISSSQDSSY